ncbi:ParD-like family protein [Pseudomonas sp. NPDC087358]|uniref:ParD-like family protein n=1 Tax=Pseudomonas sp. NPDC087358 TaxID=3364439 RepID=UPI00384A493E
MGLVKISEHMHADIRSASAALSRSINAQAEHWMRVGMLAELNPALNYTDICRVLLQAEASGDSLSSAQSHETVSLHSQSRAVSV